MTRAVRDILAECMRRERLGAVHLTWERLKAIDDAECEIIRKRADHVIRLLASYGVSLVADGDPTNRAEPSSEIYRCHMLGKQTDRAIRRGDGADDWQLVTIDGDAEKVVMTLTQAEMLTLGGRVMMGDADVMKVQGLATALAMSGEIYRVHAGSEREVPA